MGFIGWTKREMQRPGGGGSNQRYFYSGPNTFHYMIYQTIITPDGLIFYLYRIEAGRRHDLTFYWQGDLDTQL